MPITLGGLRAGPTCVASSICCIWDTWMRSSSARKCLRECPKSQGDGPNNTRVDRKRPPLACDCKKFAASQAWHLTGARGCRPPGDEALHATMEDERARHLPADLERAGEL